MLRHAFLVVLMQDTASLRGSEPLKVVDEARQERGAGIYCCGKQREWLFAIEATASELTEKAIER